MVKTSALIVTRCTAAYCLLPTKVWSSAAAVLWRLLWHLSSAYKVKVATVVSLETLKRASTPCLVSMQGALPMGILS